MENRKYRWILYFITITILSTITIQLYWNYKNYAENKRQVTNEIQLSLDNAVEEYYSSLAKDDFLTIINTKNNYSYEKSFKKSGVHKILKNHSKKEKPKVTINNIKFSSGNMSRRQIDSMMNLAKEFNLDIDSLSKEKESSTKKGYNIKTEIKYFRGKKAADSLKIFTDLKPIFISFLDQSVEYEKIDSLIKNQLKQKKIYLKTSFHHLKNDTLFHETKDSLLNSDIFSVSSKSTFVRENEAFKLIYNSPNIEALKRSSTGLLLSLLLSLAVISSLFYLLKIINQQKELAEIKNDLISNITHEFKTPITTISTAIEAIESFNMINDKEKTKKYLSISSGQLKKLHLMVEKLLETATLDSENLLLKKAPINLIDLTDKLTKKHQLITPNKIIKFSSNIAELEKNIDPFHFENAISNLIDNAIKYGGNNIEININSVLNNIEISIADNGKGIEKNQQEKIFEKFYRVPKGNTHDVKGFGIGLYYTKKIIEKHNGFISLYSNVKQTVFKIIVPND